MSEAPAADPIVQLCAFRVGDEEYVIDLRRIREIIHPLPITPLLRASELVEGVVNLRGEIIPMIDVRKRFRLPPQPSTHRTKFLVVTVAGQVLGLVVDAVSEVVRLRRSALRAAPALVGLHAPRLFLGTCGAEVALGRGGDPTGRPASAAAPGASAALGVPAAPGRIRLLLNVKALLEPIAPDELLTARELARALSSTSSSAKPFRA